MKGSAMNRQICFGLLMASCVSATGCQSVQSTALPSEMRVSQLVQDQDEPLLDKPSSNAYDALAARFSKGQAVSGTYNIYQLEPPADSVGVVREWRGQGAVATPDNPATPDERHPILSASLGPDQELQFNSLSGAQRWVNRALFHKEDGVPVTMLMSQAAAVQKARAHMMATLGPDAAKSPMYSYKTNRFINVTGAYDGSVPETKTVYQVSVAFNTTVDDLPVIGEGGKISVHLAPDGTPVQHESTVRGVAGVAASIPVNSIVPPDVARASVEQTLAARGVILAQYRRTRSEFGYFRRGSRSVQSVIGPYYAFFYEPISGNQKGIEEHVPATNDPKALQLLQDDENREMARKAALLANVRGPDKRISR